MRRVLVVAVSLLAGHAAAEPCPQFALVPRVLKDRAIVTHDGGLLVAEVSEMADGKRAIDRTTWRVRGNGKPEAPVAVEVAPGLYVYRPPRGPRAFDIVDGNHKRVGGALVTTAPPAALPAPRVHAITSGQTRSRHVSTFVDVELEGGVPDTAVALVVADPKGRARSWGRAVAGASTVNVYNTMGGCISVFPNGTVISQPGDRVVAFWVDAAGRRSPRTPVILVDKAR